LRDKFFWLNKTYELKDISLKARSHLFKDGHRYDTSKFSLNKLLAQLGKSLDTSVSLFPPKVEFMLPKKFSILRKEDVTSHKLSTDQVSKQKNAEIFPYINPSIYLRFGGSKALSNKWQAGQSWLKYVIASQNVSVSPIMPYLGYGETNKDGENTLYRKTLAFPEKPEEMTYPYAFEYFLPLSVRPLTSTLPGKSSFKSLNGRTFSQNYKLTNQIGYFNFGLSGIGRLPRLSRSFFHALFSRNKLDDFRKFKIDYLKIFLMSVPLFHNSEFSFNSSFKIFWTSVFKSKMFFDKLSFRYDFLFNFFIRLQLFPLYASLLYLNNIGTVFDGTFLNNSNIVLYNQYLNFKSYERFIFF